VNGIPGEKEVSLRKIHIIRKAKNKENAKSNDSKINLEEIYLILTEEASREDLMNIQKELLKFDLELTIEHLKYNTDKKIESIRVFLKEKRGNRVSYSWSKVREGFKFIVFYKDWKNDELGVSSDTEVLIRAKERRENSRLFIAGDRNSKTASDFLESEVLKAKEILKAKQGIEDSLIKTQKKGYHYFKACDCYIPKTFAPDFKNALFKIEDANLNGNSQFKLYDKWGNIVYQSESYNNNWNGLDIYGEKIEKGTYFFKFKANEDTEVVQEYLRIVGNDKLENADYKNNPNEVHYLISPSSTEDFDATRRFLTEILFMISAKQRYSSIYLGSDKSKPLFIVRKLKDFEAALVLKLHLEGFSDIPQSMDILPISKSNYQLLMEKKSFSEYKEFYQENY